jgi:hypothetical protein
MIKQAPIAFAKEWKVLAKDKSSWACGIYVPKCRSIMDLRYLEKHDCPELFYLISGSVKLVTMDRGRVKVITLTRKRAVVIDTWHNGFSDSRRPGAALVVERGKVRTQYLKLGKKGR